MSEIIESMRLNARLVVLSACNNAGEKPRREQWRRLCQRIDARAFMYAGAQGLVVSHWSVDSAATSR